MWLRVLERIPAVYLAAVSRFRLPPGAPAQCCALDDLAQFAALLDSVDADFPSAQARARIAAIQRHIVALRRCLGLADVDPAGLDADFAALARVVRLRNTASGGALAFLDAPGGPRIGPRDLVGLQM